jgi:hypothetical protein
VDLVAAIRERLGKELADPDLIVDHQDAGHSATLLTASGTAASMSATSPAGCERALSSPLATIEGVCHGSLTN